MTEIAHQRCPKCGNYNDSETHKFCAEAPVAPSRSAAACPKCGAAAQVNFTLSDDVPYLHDFACEACGLKFDIAEASAAPPSERELRGYWLEPGSILNSYREKTLTFDEAKVALYRWKDYQAARAAAVPQAAAFEELANLRPNPQMVPADPDEGHTYRVGFFDCLSAVAKLIGRAAAVPAPEDKEREK